VRAAALRFDSTGKSDSDEPYIFTSVPWPVLSGVPQQSISLAVPPLPGINRIQGIFIHDEDVTMLTLQRVV
jgi:hypothetical protein